MEPKISNATLVAFEELKKPNPFVDHQVLGKMYEKLGELEVELDEDPLLHGPARLRSLVAQARNYRTECERFYLYLAHQLHLLRSNHRRAKAALDIKVNHLLANDSTVRSQRNLDTQRAMAYDMYIGEYVRVQQFEQAVDELALAEEVVKAKKADLRDVQTRLGQQMRLCLEEISALGSRWSRLKPGQKPPSLRLAPAGMDPVDEMIADAEHSPAVAARSVESTEDNPTLSREGNEEEVNDFISDLVREPQRSDNIEDLDLDSILSKW